VYASLQDLIDRYGAHELVQVADRSEPPSGSPDSDIVDRALTDASATIDTYLSAKYAVPASPVPASIQGVCCTIARYLLHDDHATDRIRQAYEDAMRWLRDVSTGKAIIAELVPEGTSSVVAVRAPPVVFSDAVLETIL
jgi:phage gp36-like protein